MILVRALHCVVLCVFITSFWIFWRSLSLCIAFYIIKFIYRNFIWLPGQFDSVYTRFIQGIMSHFQQEEEISLCVSLCVAFYHQLIVFGYNRLLFFLILKKISNFLKKKKLFFRSDPNLNSRQLQTWLNKKLLLLQEVRYLFLRLIRIEVDYN